MFEKVLRKIDKQIPYTDLIKTKEMVKLEKQQKQEALLRNIETELYPIWLKTTNLKIPKEELIESWNELMQNLYHCKALNKPELHKQLDYVRNRKNGI